MRTRILGVVAVVTLLASGPAFAQVVPVAPPVVAIAPPVAAIPPSSAGRPDIFQATPGAYAPRYDHPVPPPLAGGGYVVYGPWGPWPQWSGSVQQTTVSNGYLALQVQPTSAQVYVDGLYVGTVNDVRGEARGESLVPGAHRLALRAPGYEPIDIDVRIAPGQTTVYRGDLRPAPEPAPRPSGSIAVHPKTFYVIPGCYAGDKRPETARLPRGCDASKLRTIPPVVARVDVPSHS